MRESFTEWVERASSCPECGGPMDDADCVGGLYVPCGWEHRHGCSLDGAHASESEPALNREHQPDPEGLGRTQE